MPDSALGCLAYVFANPSRQPCVVCGGVPLVTLGKEVTSKQTPFFRRNAPLPRLGTTTHDTCSEDTYSTLLQRYQRSEEELRSVAEEWLECQQRIDAYVDEQVSVCPQHLPWTRPGCQGDGRCRRKESGR